MRSGAKKGIDPKQPSPGTLVRKWAEAAPGGKWRTQTRAALALTLRSVSLPPWFHTSKLAFSICIPGLHPFWSVILALVDSSWLVMANLTEVGAHSHPSHSVTGSTALIKRSGDRKDDLGRLCVSRLAPLRCVLSPCVFPEYCVPSTSDSHVIFPALTAVDTPASQAEAGGWGWGTFCFLQPLLGSRIHQNVDRCNYPRTFCICWQGTYCRLDDTPRLL